MAGRLRDHIDHSVGAGGRNLAEDVVRIQAFLNMVPPSNGGPSPRLKQDGYIGPKTNAAIKKYQLAAFGSSDDLIEPNRRTEKGLLMFEQSPGAYGKALIADAKQQAQKWLQASAPRVLAGLTPDGEITPNGQADEGLKDMLLWMFRLKPIRKTGHETSEEFRAAQLVAKVRKKFADAQVLLGKDVGIIEIKYLDMNSKLKVPDFHTQQPIHPGSGDVRVNYKFAEWDSVSGYGIGPMTRAALLLQSVFIGVDYVNNEPLGCDEMWIVTSVNAPMVTSDIMVSDSGRYLFFCQAMAVGCRRPTPFYHVEGGSQWQDAEGLP